MENQFLNSSQNHQSNLSSNGNENFNTQSENLENSNSMVENEKNIPAEGQNVEKESISSTVEIPINAQTQDTSPENFINSTVVDKSQISPPSQEETSNPNERRKTRREKIMESFAEVKNAYGENRPITVHVFSRVRGGLRVFYKEAPLFLPASHFNLRKTPTDDELLEVVNKDIKVYVHEIQEYDEGSMAVIVSRKRLLEEEIWNNLKPGTIVEGKISSIATFGIFLDLGGVEGLIHVSRLAPYRIENLTENFKLGESLKAVVLEIDKEHKRISLSRKELVSQSAQVSLEKYSIDSIYTGIVKRLVDFGAFIELEPGVEGLLRIGEISWTRRVRRPHEFLKVGDKIQVKVLNVNPEKRMISLSLKRVADNPWTNLSEKYPVNSEFQGVVSQVVPQGCVITLNSEVDGFLPRSKMRHLLRGNKIPFKSGDKVKVFIADIVPNEESLILGLVEDEQPINSSNSSKTSHSSTKNFDTKPLSQGISLMDILPEDQKENLLKTLNK